MTDTRFPIVVLISGSGSNLQAIIDASQDGRLPVTIRAVISNRPNVKGLERAQKAGIPAIVVNHQDFDGRERFDQALMQTIDEYQPKLVVLAGFMRILTEDFVNHYLGRMINIHPSLLPKYQGLNTHQRAIDAGDSHSGASIHFVTPELDGGPVILQQAITIEDKDNAESLAQRVLSLEHRLYPQAILWIAQGRVRLDDDGLLFDEQPLSQPLASTPDF